MSTQTATWIPVSERLPEVTRGTREVFIVAMSNGETAEAAFLNEMELEIHDDSEDRTGWHLMRTCDQYDEFFIGPQSDVTHWAEPLKHPRDLPAE